jgi:arginase
MFKHLLLYPCGLGQLKWGLNVSPLCLNEMLCKQTHIISRVNTLEYNTIYDNLKTLYKSVIAIKDPVLTIGGDHSQSIATVQGSLLKEASTKVLWIDAHADINTYNSSLTKNIHGMPLSILTGLDNTLYFNFNNRLLEFSKLFYVGIRDLDEYEKNILQEKNISHVTSKDIHNNFSDSMEKISNFIYDSPLHVSLDVDVLDPRFMYCTGTKVSNGLTIKQLDTILKLINYNNIVGMDLTELNLYIGNNTQKNDSLKHLSYLLKDYVKLNKLLKIKINNN